MGAEFNKFLMIGLSFKEHASLQPMTNTLRMEAAMCLWEAFIDLDNDDQIRIYRAKIGTVAARHDLMNLVEPLHIGWRIHELAAGDAVACPFDWEFTPWFLKNCVEFYHTGHAVLKANWQEQCRKLRGNG